MAGTQTRTQILKRIELREPEKDLTSHIRYLKQNKIELAEMGLFLIETSKHGGEEIDIYNHESGATMVTYSYDGGMGPYLIIGGTRLAAEGLVSLIESRWGIFEKKIAV